MDGVIEERGGEKKEGTIKRNVSVEESCRKDYEAGRNVRKRE